MNVLSLALEAEGPFDAVIGPGCSVACEPTAFLTSARNLAQISPSCGSSVLSDKSKYPVPAHLAFLRKLWPTLLEPSLVSDKLADLCEDDVAIQVARAVCACLDGGLRLEDTRKPRGKPGSVHYA